MMNDLYFLFRGIIIGFAIAAPVGPIAVLCMQRTLQKGRMSGFVSGLGAATVDAMYGMIVALGLTAISMILVNLSFYLQIGGGLFLVYLGVKTFRKKVFVTSQADLSKNLLKDYFSTVLLTFVNPATILSFVAIFASLGIVGEEKSMIASFLMVLGVFFGSLLWWWVLSFGVGCLKNKLSQKLMKTINKISGIILCVFGILAFVI